MTVSNATMPTGSTEPNATQSTLFAPPPISKMVNASLATPVTPSLVEAVESLSRIPIAKNTTMRSKLAISAH